MCPECPYDSGDGCLSPLLEDVVETLKAMRNCMNCEFRYDCMNNDGVCGDWTPGETE